MNKSTGRRAGLMAGSLVVALLGSALPARAHHGWGGYEEKTTNITGTVQTPVSLAGPHATMKILSDGKVWDVVMAPPARAAQAGLKEGLIPVGAQVIVHGNRHMDAKKLEIKTSRLTWNGRVFNVYPDRD